MCIRDSNGIPVFTFTNNKSTLKQLSLIGSTLSFYIPRLNDHDRTLKKVKNVLKKYYDNKKNLKFIMVSGIFSEDHSEAMQIINF